MVCGFDVDEYVHVTFDDITYVVTLHHGKRCVRETYVMAPISQNGYSANDINLTHVYTVGDGRKIRLRKGPAGQLLALFMTLFDIHVEDIDAGQLDDWGYAERPIRGTRVLSNHASGTACDINALKHVQGRRGTFAPNALKNLRELLGLFEGCIRWGGDYSGPAIVDEMHFEINKAESDCSRVLAKLNYEGDEMNAEQSLMLKRIYAQLTGTEDIKAGFPGYPSKKYPHERATPVDFIRYIDLNVIDFNQKQAAQLARLETTVNQLADMLRKVIGSANA